MLREISLEEIALSPYQMRRQFAVEEIKELAASIEEVGLIQPIIVRPKGEKYELVAGERRLRALRHLRRDRCQAIVRSDTELKAAVAALVENVQRLDLNPIEEARGYQSLLLQFSLSQEELAKRVGKKRSTVANFVRLLSLPETIQEAISSGKISMGHAKALLSLPTKDLQLALYQKIIDKHLNVRQAENLAAQRVKRVGAKRISSPYLSDIKKQLQELFMVDVEVTEGEIIFKWDTLDRLDQLLELFGIRS